MDDATIRTAVVEARAELQEARAELQAATYAKRRALTQRDRDQATTRLNSARAWLRGAMRRADVWEQRAMRDG